MGDTDTIPLRSELIGRLQRANRIAVPWVVIQIALAVLLAWQVRWERIFDQPLFALVAVLVVVGPHIMGVLRHTFVNKREIDSLKEQTHFGEFDKFRLRHLVNDTLDRLSLNRPGPPVYVTADKSLNAGALHLGLGGFFRSLNGVYLNRQVLHHLTSAEVQDLIGHELGHFYRYYLISQRFQGLTMLLGALGALLVAQWLGMSSTISVIALSLCGSVFWVISGWLYARNAIAIEYLCDDFGAQVHGVVVSINGLLKIAALNEVQLAIHQQELSLRRHGNLNSRDIIEAIEVAIPYGHTSREQLEKAVTESLARRSKDRGNLSIRGFLEYAWTGDEDSEEFEDQLSKYKKVQRVARMDWESLLHDPARIDLHGDQIEDLIEMIEHHPDEVLVRAPEELGEGDGVHPSTRSRILYLWRNRHEIETARYHG